jgi:hypothetical protein
MRRCVSAAAMLVLAACSSGQIDPVKLAAAEQRASAAIQSADPVIAAACTVVSSLDTGFQATAAAGKVDATGIAYEKTVMQIHDALCTGGAPSNVADTLARLWYAASAITGVTPGKAAADATAPSPSPK